MSELKVAYTVRLNGQGKGSIEYIENCESCEANEKEYPEGRFCASCKEDFKESDSRQ